MDSETSTSIEGSAKKRKLGSGQNPLVDLELDTKNYEIQKLKKLVQTLHEKVSELEEEKLNANSTLDKENTNIKANQEIEDDKKKFEEEIAKMKLLVKDKEKEIKELKAEISSKSKNEEKLQTKIVNLEKSLGTLKTQNSKMEKEIKSFKSKTPKSTDEPGLQYVTLEEIVNGGRVNTDLLSPEHVLTVAKLEATEGGLWNIYSTETTVEPFKMNSDDISEKTQFKINLTGSLTCVDEGNPSRIDEIIQCLHTCNHENLTLGYQTIDELAFTKLTPVSVKSCKLQNICVKKNYWWINGC
jgi:myosin heavy subunit